MSARSRVNIWSRIDRSFLVIVLSFFPWLRPSTLRKLLSGRLKPLVGDPCGYAIGRRPHHGERVHVDCGRHVRTAQVDAHVTGPQPVAPLGLTESRPPRGVRLAGPDHDRVPAGL